MKSTLRTELVLDSHPRRQAGAAVDGRSRQEERAAPLHEVIAEWLAGFDEDDGVNLAALHDRLVEEHRYGGSLRSVQRYVKRHFPEPKRRARRRVETPPGAQAQVDWGHFPGIRDHRLCAEPARRHWESLGELQGWTDGRVERSARRRLCLPTGTSVWEAWQAELPFLGPVPIPPEPFDLVATRTLARDCTVAFEGRRYSVPFGLLGQRVEVRGCASRVQVLAGARVVASHPRHTDSRLLLDPEHYEGEATDRVLPPQPLGKMGRRLQEIAAMVPEKRPLDLYAALAEVAR